MQKYIKKVRGKDNKLYTVKKYAIGSNSHHFNKRRLKKIDGTYYIMKFIDDDSKMPSDIAIQMYRSKHRQNLIGTNANYDMWQWGDLGKPRDIKAEQNKQQKYWDRIDRVNNEQNDKTANSYINGYDDLLDEEVDKAIINPSIKTVSQFINYMFGKYNTVVHTTDAKGHLLKFWHLTELNGFHHCPDDNMRWLSQRSDHKDGYSAKNVEWGIKHNSLLHIRLAEQYVPPVKYDSNTIIIFELWGDIGVNYTKIQRYLEDKYNVIPFSDTLNYKKLTNYLNRFIKTKKLTSTIKTKSNMISRIGDYSEVNAIVKKYQNKVINGKEVRVIPIKFVIPNQSTQFRRLRKRYLKESSETKLAPGEIMMIKYRLKRNHKMELKDGLIGDELGGSLVKHSLAILANKPKRLKQGLDWTMHNKRFEPDRYIEAIDPYDDKGRQVNMYAGLNDVLSSY